MKNFEKYEKEILSLSNKSLSFGLRENKLYCCGDIICRNCMFSSADNKDKHGCAAERMLWLYQEYVENPKLTRREKQFVDLMGADMYLARSMGGSLFLYNTTPYKTEHDWTSPAEYFSMREFKNLEFSFIKWEDEKPWDITMLSELEVEE